MDDTYMIVQDGHRRSTKRSFRLKKWLNSMVYGRYKCSTIVDIL